MSELSLENVSYHYGDNGVEAIGFDAREGEILAIVGASGSGKSTILKLIAGFLQPTAGRILLNGDVISSPERMRPPKARSVGLVFQNHALLPHMSVRKNIEFGCPKGAPLEGKRIEAIMRELRIERLSAKYPHEISGGEAQRVSLARAMAANARVFLMDEPFSSIDSVFRRELRFDIERFLRRKDRTTVIVTHDAEEAMELADRIVVLDHGKVLQTGTPQEIYFEPAHLQVASLFGEVNHIQGAALVKELTGQVQDEIFLRPELLKLDQASPIEGKIIHIAYRGNHDMISVVIAGQRCLKVKTTPDLHHVGEAVSISAIAPPGDGKEEEL